MRTIAVIAGFTLFLALSSSAAGIDEKYRQQLERSGCTQVSELQGCDIHKTKAQNAQAGFGNDYTQDDGDAGYDDLVGTQAIKAFDQMSSRGFVNVDYIESGDTGYTIYFRRSKRECVQLTSADNRVLSIDDIGSHPKCH
jgi:hypothetical protein